MRPTPLSQKLPIAPIFIAHSVTPTTSRQKDGKLRIVYAGWDGAKVVQVHQVLGASGKLRADLTPPPKDPPEN